MVKIFRFGPDAGTLITHFDSNFMMSRILMTEAPARIGYMHLESNGIIGFHQATTPQLLIVVSGEGWVRSDTEENVPVTSGDAVYWEIGEWHETRTATGLAAIVVESAELNPAQFMPSSTQA